MMDRINIMAMDVYDNSSTKYIPLSAPKRILQRFPSLVPYASDNGEIYLDTDNPKPPH